MASSYSAGLNGHDWSGAAQSFTQQHMPTPPVASDRDECGPQTRPMGVKVLYSLKDSADNLLARWPQMQQIQTIPLDETNSIGVIDLRICLQAIHQCSPELFDQQDLDYTVYAFDYSEADTPLVGQGMLSWGLEALRPNEMPKLVTGRVTKNLLSFFNSSPKETLEVKLKLAAVARRRQRTEQSTEYPPTHDNGMQYHQQQHRQSQPQQQHSNMPAASTPTDTTEWNSFIQSNPNLARSASGSSMQQPQQPSSRNSYPQIQIPGSRPGSASIPPAHAPSPAPIPQTGSSDLARPMSDHVMSRQHYSPAHQHYQQQYSQPQPLQPLGPMHDGPFTASQSRIGTPDVKESTAVPIAKSSRPSSRARSRVPTGRPRGRPKKKPVADGNTSGLEDPTDADDGPQRKRAKTTMADWSEDRPSLDSTADSLRVVAAISGSIRSIRPVGTTGDPVGGSHLQEGPRAPTPVPQGPVARKVKQRKKPVAALSRHDSIASTDDAMSYPSLQHESSFGMSGHQRMDARSPTESLAPSEQVYTPEESPADLGSSPPVPRSTAFIRSSPAASSPVLPRMLPNPRHDSGFMSGGIDGGIDDDEAQTLPPQKPRLSQQREASPKLPKIAKPVPRKGSNVQSQGFPFMEEIPGPQELLPQTSIYNPPRSQSHRLKQQQESSVPPAMKRSNTEPKSRRTSVPELPIGGAALTPAVTPTAADQPLPSVEEPSTKGLGNVQLSQQDARNPSKDSSKEPVLKPQEQNLEQTAQEDFQQESSKGEGISDEQLQALMAAASVPEPDLPMMLPPNTSTSRPTTSATPVPENNLSTVTASDPVGPQTMLTLPLPPVSYSEAPCPPSDTLQEQTTSNKNYAKKQTIKERLQQAIEQGEMPPFCSNCGAIETPTWRKMWTQDHVGSPGFHDYSEKPGLVTAIDILERDKDDNPTSYRLVKKSLGPGEDKALWNKSLICNPCGIWLGKFKCHRPPEQWDKNLARLNQPRRKRDKSASSGNGRSKKARTKSDAQLNLTSEACYMTDPLGPGYEQLGDETNNTLQSRQASTNEAQTGTGFLGSPNSRGPGSTHSRGSGTAQSPIAVEDDLGPARRLLFPSPRKDGVPKVLGESAINIVKPGPEFAAAKPGQNASSQMQKTITPTKNSDKEMADLFGTPPMRPSTPPPNGSSGGPFKTPTRPTPSHRPITRSVSKSIRSQRTVTMISPSRGLAGLQRTPSRTPGRQHLSAHFAVEDMAITGLGDSPFPATLSQLLSEANGFTNGSPSHGLGDLGGFDLSSNLLDFDNVLNTNMPMPSSPPLIKEGGVMNYDPSWDMTTWSHNEQEDCTMAGVDVGQNV
ncbi:hypothetical protein M0657_000333 [Pyricularia oryzae]|uniref:Ams2/SPT21 N-terminal domain-containing protein n=2 Tax=Pyricularia oryzae TaxID=318829 RepID=A0AA97NZ95_PYRO3|nr:hypothetical protein OOU_Y34scaffold00514g61 [Pyricularia oryzae Y34]KAI7932584.1 hypothetical protein M0657_000333 [Pyricularia oryzae]